MAEIIIEVCVGILMKTVPTIQVMTINIQLKVIAGLLLMFVLAVPMSDAIERYMADMMESVESVLPMIMP
jgi:flagellar biosynthetic protein FliR